MSVLVVIVNWRTAELTIDCLRSLAPELSAIAGARAVVADNASDDGSADRIEQSIANDNWHSFASVLRLPRNGGFAYGNNAAISQGRIADPPFRYFHLLNPDTLVRPAA